MVPWYAWGAFSLALGLLLAIDLGAHRRAHTIAVREAVSWTIAWVALALAFGGLLWWWRGADTAGQFVAGYLIEWSLSVDNVFVFVLILANLAVPGALQHRVLFWGVVGAILMRLGFILGGAALIQQFEWTALVFGAVLLATAVRFARDRHVEEGRAFRWTRSLIPVSDRYEGSKLLTRSSGRLAATPLLAAIVLVNVTDVVFAIDSIPAIFSVTRDPFVAFTSNALAILGLRSLYFVVHGAVGSLEHLRPALAAVLAFVAAKMVLSPWVHVPTGISLGVIGAILAVGVAASLLIGRRRPRAHGPRPAGSSNTPRRAPGTPRDTAPSRAGGTMPGRPASS
jgi:tellurite resistance protein TerC